MDLVVRPVIMRDFFGFLLNDGVPPLGLATQMRIFVDPDLLKFDEVWAAAGTWHDVFPIDPRVLQSVTNGVVVELRRTP
jgi:prolyl-tRNA editing enzyme YbaK/EbsC (Cys-tRNA(Pro) deacylase)